MDASLSACSGAYQRPSSPSIIARGGRRVGRAVDVHRAGSGYLRSFGPTETQMVSSPSSSSGSSSTVGMGGGRYHDVCAFGGRCGAVRLTGTSIGKCRGKTTDNVCVQEEFVVQSRGDVSNSQSTPTNQDDDNSDGSGCCSSRGKWGTAHRSSPLSLELACRGQCSGMTSFPSPGGHRRQNKWKRVPVESGVPALTTFHCSAEKGSTTEHSMPLPPSPPETPAPPRQ